MHLDLNCHLHNGSQEGVIHLDLKPNNVLVSKNTAKISDFGLSKLQQHAQVSSVLLDGRGAGGTLGWQAPEQLLPDHKARKRTDVFTLGLILYFVMTKGEKSFDFEQAGNPWRDAVGHKQALSLFTGRHPFGKTDLERQSKILKCNRSPLDLHVRMHPRPASVTSSRMHRQCNGCIIAGNTLFGSLPCPGQSKPFTHLLTLTPLVSGWVMNVWPSPTSWRRCCCTTPRGGRG